MRHRSIRFRLTLWYSAILAAGLALFGAAMWLALEHRLVVGVDAELSQRVRGLQTVLEVERADGREQMKIELSEFAREVENGGLMRLSDPQGVLLPAGEIPSLFTRSLSTAAPVYSTVEANGARYRVLAGRFENGGRLYSVAVAAPLAPVYSVLQDFGSAVLLIFPVLMAAAGLGGYWLSRRALTPVDEITRAARSIHVHNLSQRLPVLKTGDELQRMSEAWNEVLERLDASVKRMRQFTADASHELRTPIALVRATAELALRRERPAEQYRRALIEIQAEAERMTALAESLLSVARADSGALAMPLAPADLNRIVTEVVNENQPLASAKNIRLHADPAGVSTIVSINESGIRRVLTILIENALKYTPQHGDVTVRVVERSEGVEVAVEDSGEGIEPAALPHIFERFYRADPSRADRSGAGLGLAIAHAIAQAHGSDIAVQSSAGAGSRFSILLRS